ncbi:MAG: TrmO family methyltransferase, partial [Methanoculleus sp.]
MRELPQPERTPTWDRSSPYKERGDAPRQGRLTDLEAEFAIGERYPPGLFRSEGKEHLLVLCWLDQADRTAIRTAPLHNPVGHGMFATCSHNWPNPIGLSCFWRHRCI